MSRLYWFRPLELCYLNNSCNVRSLEAYYAIIGERGFTHAMSDINIIQLIEYMNLVSSFMLQQYQT